MNELLKEINYKRNIIFKKEKKKILPKRGPPP